MKFLNSLSMKSKIVLLASVFAFGFLTFGATTFRTIALSKIGSPMYEQLVDAKALRADILPPPGYIVETYLMSHLTQDAADPASSPEKLAERLAQYEKLKSEYKTFVETWEGKLPPGEIREDLLKTSREPAEEFFALLDNEFLPAIKARDFDKASDVIDNKLPPVFDRHYKAMMDVVEHVNKLEADTQAKADALVARNGWILCLIGFSVLCAVVGFSWWIRSGVARQEAINLDYAGQIAAISRSQGVIEFDTTGHILAANENFLKLTGYTLDEIKGRHHGMFMDENARASAAYKELWAGLARGEHYAAECKRVRKDGRVLWLQSSYNPILDGSGKPTKVVKFATDITAQVVAREELKEKVDLILQVVDAAAEGDLTNRIPVKGEDAIGQMGEALERFIGDLRHSISSIAENATALAGARKNCPPSARR